MCLIDGSKFNIKINLGGVREEKRQSRVLPGFVRFTRRTHTHTQPTSQRLLWIVCTVAGRGFVRASDVCRYKKVIQLHNQLLASFFPLSFPSPGLFYG